MKKQKHPRLPNGMGSIKYLGKGRTKPYAVFPPEYNISERGNMIYKRAICYVPDWYTGFAVLMAWKAGTYRRGDELKFAGQMKEVAVVDDLARRILDDYRIFGHASEQIAAVSKHKLGEVFDEYYERRFGEYAYEPYSEKTARQYRYNWKAWSGIYDRYIEDLRAEQIQEEVNAMAERLSHNSVRLNLLVLKNVISYATEKGYIQHNPTASVKIPIIAKEEEHADPYTAEDLAKLWDIALNGDDVAISVLIQCYSGFRISAYKTMIVDLKAKTMTGGVKTGKNRTVPIHSAIYPFVYARMTTTGSILGKESYEMYRIHLLDLCRRVGIKKKTTHSARHTFKMLCDRYGVNPVASRILMGHSLKGTGTDIHDSVYSHFEVEDLRREIEKIVV